MDFGPAVYRGSWAGLGRGSWLDSGGGGGAVGSWIRGFVGAVRGFVDPWGVRGFVGGSWEIRGFVGSWVSGWVRGFVDSFARFRVRGVSFPKASAKGSRCVRNYTGEKLHHRLECVPANR